MSAPAQTLARTAVTSAALLLLAATARAESDAPGSARERNSAPLWDELAHPGNRRAQALLRSALYQEREAARLLPTVPFVPPRTPLTRSGRPMS